MKLELLTGGYEKPEREAVLRFIQPEWAVVELGSVVVAPRCRTWHIVPRSSLWMRMHHQMSGLNT